MHFSEGPPPAAVAKPEQVAELVVDDSRMTVIEPPPDIPAFREGSSDTAAPASVSMSSRDFLPTPKNVQKLVKDAQNVQNLVDQRQGELQAVLGE